MKKEKYYPQEHAKGQFHCPHCGVFAKQRWSHLSAIGDAYTKRGQYGITYRSNIYNLTHVSSNLEERWSISFCEHCSNIIIWLDKNTVFPKKIIVSTPNEDLDEDIQKDYLEAANIFSDSPRASAALLRLALQKLCKQLGEKGKDINKDIKNLVKKGLSPQIQKSLDILRITGNNAVHPGQINIIEKSELVLKLFELINFIAEKMITEPKEIEGLYELELPKSAKEQIEKRDNQE